MNDDAMWLIAMVTIVGLLLFSYLAHEYIWVSTADDYSKCLSSCTNTLDSFVSDEELRCAEICLPLSECDSGEG